MPEHRTPRKRLPKSTSTSNPPRRERAAADRRTARDRRELSAAYRAFVKGNPRAASAVLNVLQIVSESDRRRAMALVEAAGTVFSNIRGRS